MYIVSQKKEQIHISTLTCTVNPETVLLLAATLKTIYTH